MVSDDSVNITTMRPVLYSFRRCPYAIRARMALMVSGQTVALREVVLARKPAALLLASNKATVPVLVLPNGQVIDESRAIMLWALSINDPDQWLAPKGSVTDQQMMQLIDDNDGAFKIHLDHYKYADRYPAYPVEHYRSQGESFLQRLESLLADQPCLMGYRLSLVDVAIAPFIRQFAQVDRNWFDQAPYPHLQAWLAAILASDLFIGVMEKYAPWEPSHEVVLFPT